MEFIFKWLRKFTICVRLRFSFVSTQLHFSFARFGSDPMNSNFRFCPRCDRCMALSVSSSASSSICVTGSTGRLPQTVAKAFSWSTSIWWCISSSFLNKIFFKRWRRRLLWPNFRMLFALLSIFKIVKLLFVCSARDVFTSRYSDRMMNFHPINRLLN